MEQFKRGTAFYQAHACLDSFVCKQCGQLVTPDGAGSRHRNHCPRCLHSLHVDERPGDRASVCEGVMEPISVWVRKSGEWAIVHRCKRCGHLSSNRIAADDNPVKLMSLAVKPLAEPPFPLEGLMAGSSAPDEQGRRGVMAAVDLRAYGVTDALMQRARETSGVENPVVGRVLSQAHELYRVIGADGELVAEVAGKLRHAARSAADFPAVGDFVLMDRSGDAGGHAIVEQVLPRASVFVRKAAGASFEQQVVAANVDTAFLCMSLAGDFNLRRLERYLTLAWESGAVPVAVLTKADACDNVERRLVAVQSVALGVDVLAISSTEEGGCEAVRPYLRPGKTVALLGSSGVGKSTLVNRLLGENVLETRAVRADGRGRHATTRRQLMLLPEGGLVMDTPGMRELGIGEAFEGLG